MGAVTLVWVRVWWNRSGCSYVGLGSSSSIQSQRVRLRWFGFLSVQSQRVGLRWFGLEFGAITAGVVTLDWVSLGAISAGAVTLVWVSTGAITAGVVTLVWVRVWWNRSGCSYVGLGSNSVHIERVHLDWFGFNLAQSKRGYSPGFGFDFGTITAGAVRLVWGRLDSSRAGAVGLVWIRLDARSPGHLVGLVWGTYFYLFLL